MLKYVKTLALVTVVGLASVGCSSSDPAPAASSTADATLVIGDFSGNYTTSLTPTPTPATIKLSSPSQANLKVLVTGLAIGDLSFDASVSAPVNNVINFSVPTQTNATTKITVGGAGGKNPTGTYNTSTKELNVVLDVTVPGSPFPLAVTYKGTKK